MIEAEPSAVAVLETPGLYLLEGRPAREGQLAHSGRIQFFGGHIDPKKDANPQAAVERELHEELDGLLYPSPPELIWEGLYGHSQTREGRPASRYVHLFRLALPSAKGLRMKVDGELIKLPKTPEAVNAIRARLTPFVYSSLRQLLTRGQVERP
jgi:8-oxo-dGTP pyrophosphatase MutT (NUDIX family)